MPKIIGIDLGTSNSAAAVMEGGKPVIIPSAEGNSVAGKAFPSYVAFTKDGQLLVEAENYHTNIKTLPAEEFPLIPEVEGKTVLKIDSQELKTAFDQVVFAASTNQTQPEISNRQLAAMIKGIDPVRVEDLTEDEIMCL